MTQHYGQVLKWAAEGMERREIAERLGISYSTVARIVTSGTSHYGALIAREETLEKRNAKVRRLHRAGRSIERIARDLDLTRNVVDAILFRLPHIA